MTATFASVEATAPPMAPSIAEVLRSPGLLLKESLAGTVTALALIPEVISFAFVTGVDPTVALVASIVLCLTMSVLGGRPAMVTAAAGSVALVVGPMVRLHGVGYILPTIVLAGVMQVAFGLGGLAQLARFIPRSVLTGFVNALGVLIFFAQVPHVLHAPWAVYPLVALTAAIVLLLPRLTTAVPAPLVAIVVVTAIATGFGLHVPSVGGEGTMPPGLPGLNRLTVPLDLETLRIVWPTAVSVAFVGLLETLLTAKLVDEVTESRSDKGRESWALGLANILAAFYGGVAGCAMIGQTVVNVSIGGARTRVSTAVAGLAMLLLVTAFSPLMAKIPLCALAAVMMIVALKTVNWRSVRPATMRRMPVPETTVMLATVTLTVATGNLAVGVVVGVLLALAFFARRLAHGLKIERQVGSDGEAVRYTIHGPLFFGSSHDLVDRFAYAADPGEIFIDLSRAQIWDASSVAVLDAVQTRYREQGAAVAVTGLDERSTAFYERLTGRL